MPAPRGGRGILPLLLVAIVTVGWLNLIAGTNSTLLERFLASLLIAIAFLPAVRFISKGENTVPFLPLLGWVYAVHYAFPVFLLESYSFRDWLFTHAAVERALWLAVGGFVVLLVTFYGVPGAQLLRFLPKVRLRWDAGKVRRTAPFFVLVGLCISYYVNTVPPPDVLEQVLLFLSNLSLLGICMLFILQLQGKLGGASGALLWGLFLPLQLMIDLSTGAVYQVFKDVIPLMLIYWSMRRRIPWAAILIGIIALILLRGNQQEFRFLSNDPTYLGASIPEKSRLYLQLVFDNTRTRGVTDAYTSTLERVSHLVTLADVVEQTPATVPYWGGETYKTLLTSFIPRVMWPDKPTKELGQIFGHRYGRLHPEDEVTSDNLPQLVEMYANFGPPGIAIGMIVVGFLYCCLYWILNHPEAGEGALSISAIIFTHLLSIESDFSLVFGSVVQYLVLLYIVLKAFRVKESPTAHEDRHLESRPVLGL